MSLDDSWAQGLGDVELSFLYRICNRLIEADHKGLESKGEQDVAWAVKQEYECRAQATGSNPGVF